MRLDGSSFSRVVDSCVGKLLEELSCCYIRPSLYYEFHSSTSQSSHFFVAVSLREFLRSEKGELRISLERESLALCVNFFDVFFITLLDEETIGSHLIRRDTDLVVVCDEGRVSKESEEKQSSELV